MTQSCIGTYQEVYARRKVVAHSPGNESEWNQITCKLSSLIPMVGDKAASILSRYLPFLVPRNELADSGAQGSKGLSRKPQVRKAIQVLRDLLSAWGCQ